jgi:hypothetical protein
MPGQYLDIGGRRTYVPPFVHERFDGPPYWACTFASLLNGANVAWLGQKPATADEIRALARASGDLDLKGGSRSSHMVKAMRKRYGRNVEIERLPAARAKERLATGWAMVAAVTYGAMPETHRRWSPHFRGGHRVTVLGWDDGRMRLLDPMADRDETYAGQWIQWSEFEPAWWSGEQLWFREGMALAGPVVHTVRTFEPARHWTVRGGTTVSARSADDPRAVAKRALIRNDSGASFDALVEATPRAPGAVATGRYIRVANGMFAGMLIDVAAPGIAADTREAAVPAVPRGAAVQAGAAVRPGVGAAARPGAGAAEARPAEAVARAAAQAEWDRIHAAIEAGQGMPPRP